MRAKEHITSLDLSGDIAAALEDRRPERRVDSGRRKFLLGMGAAATSLLLPAYADAALAKETDFSRVRSLRLYRPYTREGSQFVYWRDGKLDRDGYRYANYLLRDVRAKESIHMSVELLHVMAWVQAFFRAYGYNDLMYINSGYRSQRTNDKTEGAAKKSLHMRGMAVDGGVTNIPTSYFGELMKRLSQGGVGVYPNDKFVHYDVGRVRSWRG